MEIAPYIIIIILCLVLEAFFSGSEIAVVSMDRIKLKHMLRKRARGAHMLNRMLKKPDWFLGTTLIGTNLATVVSNTVGAFLFINILGDRYAYLALFFTYPLQLIFAEILPKTVFQQRANEIAPKIILPLKIATYILSPVVFLASRVSSFISYLLGSDERERDFYVTKEELELLLKMSDAKAGGMKITQKKMIDRIFDFKETSVKEVMIPSINVKAVEIDEPIDEVISKLKEWKHSRVPVYRERFDNIVGVVTVFDFILPRRRKSLKSYVRPLKYFPEYTPIDDIMVKLQKEGEGMACVVDEYGGVSGVVTLEDIIEEVVGEIDDEYDFTQTLYKKISDKEFIMNAHISLNFLKDELSIIFPEGDYETLAGFILDLLKKIPKRGEICKYKNIQMEITKCSPRTIEEIRLLIIE